MGLYHDCFPDQNPLKRRTMNTTLTNSRNHGLLNKSDFTKWALRLAMPIMIQNLISTLVSSADTVMLGYVSQTAMSASALANQFFFVLDCIYYGLITGTSVLVSQYWGKKDTDSIERIMGLAIRFSVGISLVFTVLTTFAATPIMRIFSDNEETVAAGASYLRILGISFAFMGFSRIYLSALRSIEKVTLPTVTYVISLCVNVLMNATFIFGLFGAPKMGVTGVAIGTVTARIVEAVICVIHSGISYRRIAAKENSPAAEYIAAVDTSALSNDTICFRLKYCFTREKVLTKDYLKVSLPATGNDLIWALASSMFAVIMGHMGDDMVAANAVASMVVNIGAIACRGFANATTIIVGKTLGENNLEATRVYSGRMLRLTIYVSLLGCGVILLLRPFIVNLYSGKLTETALTYLGYMMIMTTWRLVGEGINTCLICGCFRGGGDSRFGMITDTIFMWLVALPLMAAAEYIFHLPAMWVYFVMTLDEFEKMPVVFAHYKKYNWMKNITR